VKNYVHIVIEHKRPLRFLVGRFLVKSGLCRLLTIQQNGYCLRFYPSNLSEQLWLDRSWREPELRFVKAYLRLGDHAIDVGANVGDTALTASLEVGTHGWVWAIEPHPRTFAFLTGNIRLNGAPNITAINAAAAAQPGRLMFEDGRRDDMNRVGELGVHVEVQRLDDIVSHRGRIDLLKIDVEGYELPVLYGAPEILKATRCIYFEVSKAHFRHFGYDIGAVLALLEGCGFLLLKLDGEQRLTRISSAYTTERVENLIAVRDLEELTERVNWALA
jgi:FkbM family methyltransferase